MTKKMYSIRSEAAAAVSAVAGEATGCATKLR